MIELKYRGILQVGIDFTLVKNQILL